jgi:excisionase family DNA binding protein
MEGLMAVERLALSVSEAAAALGVSKDAIYDAVRCHELPAIRIRRRILIPLSALQHLLAEKKGRMSSMPPSGVPP